MTGRSGSSALDADEALERVVAESPLDLDDAGFFRTLVETASPALVTVDGDGTVVFATPAVRDVLGHRPADLVGRSVQMIVPDGRFPGVVRRSAGAESCSPDGDAVRRIARHAEGHDLPVSFRVREHVHEGQRLVTGVIEPGPESVAPKGSLRMDERHLDQAQRLAEVGSWELDPSTGDLQWSAEVYRLFDLPRDESPTYERFLEFVHPDDRAAVDEAWKAALAGEEYDLEHRIVVNGETRWVRETAAVTFDSEGTPRRAVGVVHDVTERKERERELERQAAFLAESTDIVSVMGADGTIQYISPSVERSLGYEPDELQGTQGFDLVHPDDLEALQSTFADLCASPDENTTVEGRFRTVDDEWRWLEVRASNQLENPAVGGIVVNSRDITERKQQKERFRAFLEHSTDVISILEPDGTYQYRSSSGRDTAGYAPDELVGKNAFDFIHPDDREAVVEAFEAGVDDPETTPTVEFRFEQRDGSYRWMEAIGNNQLDNPAVEGFVVNSRDVTARKERERELERLKERLDLALEAGRFGVWDWDVRTDEVTFNEAWAEMLGYTLEELEPRVEAWKRRVHPDDLPRAMAALEAHFAGETGYYECELRMETKSGEWRWIRDVGKVFERDEEGDPVRAVGIHQDVTDRKERERTLERQRSALERVRQITESLRPLNRALTRASTREDIERAVCDHLATSDAYGSVWYGDYVPERDCVSPQEWAGLDGDPPDEIPLSRDDPDDSHHHVGRAVDAREVRAVRPRPTDSWDDDAGGSANAVAAVPVVFDGAVYGVIGIHSCRPNAFEEYEREMLRELGERVGHAVHAAENERLLHTDTVVELEFRTTSSASPFVRVSDELDCRLDVETVLPGSDNVFLCYATVAGAAPDRVADALSRSRAVDAARVVDASGEEGTVECRLREAPMTKLLDYGATVTTDAVEAGEERIVAEVAPEADTHTITSAIQAAYPETVFVAKRSVDRPVRSITVTQDTFEDVLTDRQREVLELAYRAGYFASPRRSTGEELADGLGISSATFYLHVRKATERILEQIDARGLFE